MSSRDQTTLFNPFDLIEDSNALSLYDLPQDLRSILRRMSKRDLNTRLKGIQEMLDFIKSSPDADFILFRPHFSKLYCRCSVDVERRIRDGMQRVLACVLDRDKKYLGPIIREILFYWIGTMHEPVLAIASHAKSLFDSSFSPAKIGHLCTFAGRSLAETAQSYLTFRAEEEMAANLSDGMDKGDAQFVFALQISFSLAAISFLVKNNSSALGALKAEFPAMFDILQYLKFVSCSSDSFIRAAFFNFITTISQEPPRLAAFSFANSEKITVGRLAFAERLPGNCALALDAVIALASAADPSLPNYNFWETNVSLESCLLEYVRNIISNNIPKNAYPKIPILLKTYALSPNHPDGSSEERSSKFIDNLWLALKQCDPLFDQERMELYLETFLACLDLQNCRKRCSYFDTTFTTFFIERPKFVSRVISLKRCFEIFQKHFDLSPLIVARLEDERQLGPSLPGWLEFFLTELPIDFYLMHEASVCRIAGLIKSQCPQYVQWILFRNMALNMLSLVPDWLAEQVVMGARRILASENVQPSAVEQEIGALFGSEKLRAMLAIEMQNWFDMSSPEEKLGIYSLFHPQIAFTKASEATVLALSCQTYFESDLSRSNLESFLSSGSFQISDCLLHTLSKAIQDAENVTQDGNVLFRLISTRPDWIVYLDVLILLAARLADTVYHGDFEDFYFRLDSAQQQLVRKGVASFLLSETRNSTIEYFAGLFPSFSEALSVFPFDRCNSDNLALLDAALKSFPQPFPENALYAKSMAYFFSAVSKLQNQVQYFQSTVDLRSALDFFETDRGNFIRAMVAEYEEAQIQNVLVEGQTSMSFGSFVEQLKKLEPSAFFELISNLHVRVPIFVERLVFPLDSMADCILLGVAIGKSPEKGYKLIDEALESNVSSREALLSLVKLLNFASGFVLRTDLLNILILKMAVFWDDEMPVASKTDFLNLILSTLKSWNVSEEFLLLHWPFLTRVLGESAVCLLANDPVPFKFQTSDPAMLDFLAVEVGLLTLVNRYPGLLDKLEGINGMFFDTFINLDKKKDLFFVGHPEVPASAKILARLSHWFRQVVPLKLDRASVDGLLAGVFHMDNIDLKLACRFVAMLKADDELVRVKLQLQKCPESEMDPVPWPSLVSLLAASGVDSDDRSLLPLELFLSLAEGAKEEPLVLNALAGFFSQSIVGPYMAAIGNMLRWNSSKPVDLSKLEFMTIDLEELLLGEWDTVLAANLAARCLKTFPAAMRQWHGQINRAMASSVETQVTRHFSPLLISRELGRIKRYSAKTSDLKLRVEQTSTSTSVQATYAVEDSVMEVKVGIPASFPLKPVSVTGSERLGISEAKWRTWMLASQTLFNSQNLSILDGLLMWKANVDKSFEGIEPCAICYCIIHPSDRSMPSPACKTCRNRFHSSCLYKWFKTGGQATCPMCRSLF